jgi:hypothetical protein
MHGIRAVLVQDCPQCDEPRRHGRFEGVDGRAITKYPSGGLWSNSCCIRDPVWRRTDLPALLREVRERPGRFTYWVHIAFDELSARGIL